ncbi:iron ABC transporter [Candidatus Marsarchaeota G2 archaeon BE_D]|jgi:ABC-type Fe3+-siderophore transport system, permease component|uniref:Iron ABC transporter n=1 Tax=Candidatus Marsarchaeota G2 archaeon BE_D TaxID=1978158 RepID=A0A2R6C9I7_9ARCH|nr:MAG: iron ABC transporter [Candidatus Marsarchaeota G2 archaeon BE_D]
MKSTRIALFSLIFFFSIFASLIYGEVYIPPSALLHPHGVYSIILERIRIPTVLAAATIGASLGVCGAVMQMLLRNPLMDPYVSGTASGGAFGAVLSYFLLAFNLPFAFLVYVSPLIAFAFALLSTFITIAIGKRTGVYGLVVGGVVVAFIFSSAVTILTTLISNRYPFVPSVTFWLQGQIVVVGWRRDIGLFALTAILVLLGLRHARRIDLVAISDEMSYARGINPNTYRYVWVILVSLVSGYIVSLVGIVGFVGIIVPHIVRRTLGGSTTKLVPYSALLGSPILLLANILSSGILGTVIPVTAITSLAAAPIIVYVMVRGIADKRY